MIQDTWEPNKNGLYFLPYTQSRNKQPGILVTQVGNNMLSKTLDYRGGLLPVFLQSLAENLKMPQLHQNASDVFISPQINQELCFIAKKKSYFLQIKLRNLHLLIKMSAIWKEQQMLGLQRDSDSCSPHRCYAEATDVPAYDAEGSGKPSVLIQKDLMHFLFTSQAIHNLKRKKWLSTKA